MSGSPAQLSRLVIMLAISVFGLIGFWATAVQAVEATSERVVLSGDGAARVYLEVQLVAGVNEVPLPAEPVPASIVVEFRGEVLPAVYEPEPPPGTLLVAVESPGTARISYVASVNVDNGVISLVYKPVTEAAELVVEPGIVLLNALASAREYRVEGDRLVIVFTGQETVRYTVSVEPEQPPAETATATVTTTEPADTGAEAEIGAGETGAGDGVGQEPTQAAPGEAEEEGGVPLVLAAAAALAVIAAAVLLLARSRRGQHGSAAPASEAGGIEVHSAELDDVDKRIVEVLRNAGGELYQSDIQRLTGLPKTTVWRHIRKLSEAGIVEIVREGKANRVRLLRDPLQGG